MKSLSNRLYLKQQLYGLHMKGTLILEHINTFNKITSDMSIDVKLDEGDKTFVLLVSSIILGALGDYYSLRKGNSCDGRRMLW